MRPRRKVLIVCGSFPPQVDIGGLRPAMFAKYLTEFGWQPYVLTRDWPQGDPYRNTAQKVSGLPGEEFIHREVLGSGFEIEALARRGSWGLVKAFFMPDLAHPPGVAEHMENVARCCWPSVRFDAVLATAPGLDSLRVGAKIAEWLRIPWVADLRDIGEQEAGMGGNLRDRLLMLRGTLRRRVILRTCSLITVVSATHKRILERQHKVPVRIVYNGFDHEMFRNGPSAGRTARFSIVYTGRILNEWYRNPEALFSGLDRLLSDGGVRPDEIEVLFYGTEPELLKPFLRNHACAALVKILARVPYQGIPGLLAKASVLLVLTNRGRQGILTSKLFEYLPCRKPILCVPGDGGELDDLIRLNGLGESCESGERVASVLSTWFAKWKSGEPLQVAANDEIIQQFSRRSQAKVLAALMESMIASSTGVAVPGK